MSYGVVLYPETRGSLIEEIRRKYDPTVDLIRPHVTVLHPVPERVGEEGLARHVKSVARGRAPFGIRFGPCRRSLDHWLFLTLERGDGEVRELHRALYTGLLAEFLRDDLEFVPQLGVGLFLKEGSKYDWNEPRESDFDVHRYEVAVQEVAALARGWSSFVEILHLVRIPEEILEWASGNRPAVPKWARVEEMREFRLAGPSRRTE